MSTEKFRDEVIRQLEEQAEFAKGKAENNKSWFRSWMGMHKGLRQAVDIVNKVHEETETHV